jgi:hypothetical protein
LAAEIAIAQLCRGFFLLLKLHHAFFGNDAVWQEEKQDELCNAASGAIYKG